MHVHMYLISRLAADPERPIEDGAWFMGGGYLKLEPVNFKESLSFSLRIHTFSTDIVEILWARNGVRILSQLLVPSFGDERYIPFLQSSELTLILIEAQVMAILEEDNLSLDCIPTSLSPGLWHNISMEINSSVIALTLDGEVCSLTTNGLFSSGIYELYLGGHPNSLYL